MNYVTKYKLFNNHIIFNIDNKIALLDTGASSIGNEDFIFMEQTFKLPKNFLGATIEQISKYVGTKIDILFGVDILHKFDLLIDAKSNTLVFSNEDMNLDGVKLKLEENSIINAVVNDEDIKLFFDTGAHTSYIQSDFVEDNITSGQIDDFFPGFGSFKTNLYTLDTVIGEEDLKLKYGVLPKQIESKLLIYDTKGIIGTDLLRHFNCLLSFRNNTMTLQKYQPKKIVFFTGAGISADSGISTFRDEDGLWEKYDIKDICTAGCLDTNRDETVEFYNKRRLDLKDKRPNKAHHTIAKLQEKYPQSIKIVTQNIDDLFEKAECKDVLHLHGFLTEVVCEDEDCHYNSDIGYESQEVSCPLCGEYIRPNVVFFGEQAPKYWDMYEILKDVDMIIIIGTSGNVINVHHLIEDAKYSVLNNLEFSYAIKDDMFDKVIYDRATVAIDEIETMVEEVING